MGAAVDIKLKIKRKDSSDSPFYWEEFNVPFRKNMNVISALMEIQKNPVNAKGENVRSVAWEYNCLEEVCGACSMRINGKVRQACSTLVDRLEQPIQLEPMETFPVEKDLVVNRDRMFSALKKIKGWIPIDGTYALGAGPLISSDVQQEAYKYSTCMTCGCCLDACPNVNSGSPFIGPQALGQTKYFNMHPTGAQQKNDRLSVMIGEEGLANCGNSQNCVQVCPKEIPLTTAIAELNKDANKFALWGWLKR
ncbi:succinate dehydrogenase / fumarate reductase iron-sulfur subunit [Cytobacillus firmus]|uniref:succinate dehydrogenase n=2 Tax=Cytobacillus TaxID=2675230 RepID=A0A366JS43_CYTFI|nr:MULTISPECIES: succinate dehydrogenase iron-sulfur subunit [Cytobacillus]RBP90590.1 succinate dehydrogenase / fumarate reductase iron-sulfur subunit [Cytobacillus firmus]TDX46172.1 succinate dehydrogenase / fumarate reductase iron-sulfur subunit [Cytobacillus oceanisediminis]